MWKILVVEDSPENRELIIEILRDVAVCDGAGNGKEAIEAYNRSLQGQPYDLILLDIEMPDIDGLEILRKIRKNEEAAGIALGDGIPIVMVTAHRKPFLDAFYQGCTDYVVKPISADKLIKKIEQKLNKTEQF